MHTAYCFNQKFWDNLLGEMETGKVCVGGKGTSEKAGKSAKSSSFIVGR